MTLSGTEYSPNIRDVCACAFGLVDDHSGDDENIHIGRRWVLARVHPRRLVRVLSTKVRLDNEDSVFR